jgi:hypothetical protein
MHEPRISLPAALKYGDSGSFPFFLVHVQPSM